MDPFKRDRFAQMYPGVALPKATTLGDAKTRELRIKLANVVGFPREVDNLALTNHLDSLLRPLDTKNAETSDFDLGATIRSVGIVPELRVFVNWYRYDRIDEFQLAELSHFFHAIWYPSSDDIEIFDATCTWIFAVTHMGTVKYAAFA